MKKFFVFFAGLSVISKLAGAVTVGDTYDQVVAEKGIPPGHLRAGNTEILNYPDQTIKLRGGKVYEIGSPPRAVYVVADAPKSAIAKRVNVETGWTTDYSAALARAKAENRQVFLFFTGSDWCGWCHKLEGEILTKGDFRDYARDNLILVKLDFPRRIQLPPDLQAQNVSLAKKFRIEGYPTVIVLDSNGRKVKVLGYQTGGPGPFIDALRRAKS